MENEHGKVIIHSSIGTKWRDHKYIAIVNGRYIYPGDKIPGSNTTGGSGMATSHIPSRPATPGTHTSSTMTGNGVLGVSSKPSTASNNVTNSANQKNRPRSRQKRVVDGTATVQKREAIKPGGSVAVGSGRKYDPNKKSQPSTTRSAPSNGRRPTSSKTAFTSSSSAQSKKTALKEKQIAAKTSSPSKSHSAIKKAFSTMNNKLRAAARNSSSINKGKTAIEEQRKKTKPKASNTALMMPGVSTTKKRR